MWNIHHNITNIALLNKIHQLDGYCFQYLQFQKDCGKPRIHRIRLINTYESAYNLILKYFWLKKGLRNVESQKQLRINQTGSRKDKPLIETATINELIIEYHRLTRHERCIHQDDTTACFDRIVMNHEILNSRKYLIPNNVCKVNYERQHHMTYKT